MTEMPGAFPLDGFGDAAAAARSEWRADEEAWTHAAVERWLADHPEAFEELRIAERAAAWDADVGRICEAFPAAYGYVGTIGRRALREPVRGYPLYPAPLAEWANDSWHAQRRYEAQEREARRAARG